MKRYLALALAGVIILSSSCYSYAADKYAATLIAVKGDVEVDPEAIDVWMPAFEGTRLKEGARVKTARRASCEVAFDDKKQNVVKVAQQTELIINTASEVELPEGKILALFENMKPGSKFEIKTPSAICGIRGSGVGVEVINFITNVLAFAGSVYAQGVRPDGSPRGRQVQVPVGQKSTVAGNQDPSPSKNMTAKDKSGWKGTFGITPKTGEDKKGDKKEARITGDEGEDPPEQPEDEPDDGDQPEASPSCGT
ncbi:FecR domain-containing protein [Candidatus Omnitrophota bacterium]